MPMLRLQWGWSIAERSSRTLFEFHTRLRTCLPVSQYIQRYATSNVSQHSGLCECADYKVGAVRLTNHIQTTTTIHLELYLVVLVLVVTTTHPHALAFRSQFVAIVFLSWLLTCRRRRRAESPLVLHKCHYVKHINWDAMGWPWRREREREERRDWIASHLLLNVEKLALFFTN